MVDEEDEDNEEPTTKINAVRCGECNDEIVSRHRHDFVRCKCGNVAVDGGNAYRKRVFKVRNWTELYDESELKGGIDGGRQLYH